SGPASPRVGRMRSQPQRRQFPTGDGACRGSASIALFFACQVLHGRDPGLTLTWSLARTTTRVGAPLQIFELALRRWSLQRIMNAAGFRRSKAFMSEAQAWTKFAAAGVGKLLGLPVDTG